MRFPASSFGRWIAILWQSIGLSLLGLYVTSSLSLAAALNGSGIKDSPAPSPKTLQFASSPALLGQTHPELGTEILNLPQVITAQGKYYLSMDHALNLPSGCAIDIQTNNVTIDLNGFKIGNLAAGPSQTASGVCGSNRQNIVVQNGAIRGFRFGVDILGSVSWGHVVRHMRLDGNYKIGARVEGDGVNITDNVVVNTGGGTTGSGNEMGILLNNAQMHTGGVIANNLVFNTGSAEDVPKYGIRAWLARGVTIANNVVANAAIPAQINHAIDIYGSAVVVKNNDLHNFDTGVYVNNSAAKCFNNFTIGMTTGFFGCTLFANND